VDITIRYTVKPTGQKIRPITTIAAVTVTEPAAYKGFAVTENQVVTVEGPTIVTW